MTQKEIKQKQKRIAEIWKMLKAVLGGIGLDGVRELVELEIELTAEDGR